jgi:hypothetical protein
VDVNIGADPTLGVSVVIEPVVAISDRNRRKISDDFAIDHESVIIIRSD